MKGCQWKASSSVWRFSESSPPNILHYSITRWQVMHIYEDIVSLHYRPPRDDIVSMYTEHTSHPQMFNKEQKWKVPQKMLTKQCNVGKTFLLTKTKNFCWIVHIVQSHSNKHLYQHWSMVQMCFCNRPSEYIVLYTSLTVDYRRNETIAINCNCNCNCNWW